MVFKYNKLITQIKLSESCNVGRFVLINLWWRWVCGVQWTAAEAHWIVYGVLIGFFIGYHVEEDVHDARVDFFVE